jgi:hypothetical protein
LKSVTRLATACLCAGALLVVARVSLAQIPDAQTIERELRETYATKPPDPWIKNRGELAQRVEKLLRRQSRFLTDKLRPWPGDENAAQITDGKSAEAGIRPNAHAAYGLAVMYRAMDVPSARRDALSILRFLLSTHAAGGATCADGKPWRDQWQSALWATSAGQAAWLLWDELTPREKWLAARMVCDEADRFVAATPPAQIARDTKAEENAWNSQALALAFNMFPRHPNHTRYREAAVRWHLSSFASAADLASDRIIEGKPLKDWLAGSGANLHDDYTLENHDRVHPDYMSSVRTLATQALFYNWADNAEPASLRFNVSQVYANLKKLALPDGGFLYPSGQDWHLHRNADWFDVHAVMAILFDDPQAARLMHVCLETAEKMIARPGNASATNAESAAVYSRDETNFASSQAMLLELFADAYLLLRARGEGAPPVEEKQLWHDLADVYRFDAGRFAVLRTDHSVASFSYGRVPMGLVLPLQKDLLLTPNVRSLIGTFDARGDKPLVRQWNLIEHVGAFLAVAGELTRLDGAASQLFAFIALEDGRVVYTDLVTPLGRRSATAPAIPHFRGALLGVLNDRNWVYHDGVRVLRSDQADVEFPAAKGDAFRNVESSAPWYNLDDALGIVCLATSGRQVFDEHPTSAPGRREQLFSLNDTPRLPAASTIIFYPSQPASKTRTAAGRVKLSAGKDPRKFSVTLDDGKRLDIDLIKLNIETP